MSDHLETANIPSTGENDHRVRSSNSAAGMATKIAAFTALIAALGSLFGSFQSLVVSGQTSETQERIEQRQAQIEARQDTLNFRDRLGWENARIGNLWIQLRTDTTVSCGTIPVDDTPKWNSYCGCLFGESCSREHNFRQVKDQERLICAARIGTCRIQQAQP